MVQATSTRRALVDLPVNTFGTPPSMSTIGKHVIGQKRQIDAVTEPEYPWIASRVKASPARDQGRLRDEMSLPKVSHSKSLKTDPFPKSAMPYAVVDPEEPADELEDGNSPNSYMSNADFDPDDTMASQQTAATEVTQLSQSRSSQHAETLRLRLRLAHFKVKTNQTHIPLSQLRISTTERQSPSPTQEPSLPKLLPAPILRPTPQSARHIKPDQVPSSPPSSPENSLKGDTDDQIFRTPALPRKSITVHQTSSPPDSQERGSRQVLHDEDSLTSSAVRGKAAIGLLGLRQEL